MRKCLLLFLLPVLAMAGSMYENKALNPVTFLQAGKHADLPLIKDGKLNFVIVRAMNDGEEKAIADRRSVSIAVQALQDAFERVTGQVPKVVDASSKEAADAPMVISLGKNKLSEAQGIDFKGFGKEGFIVRSFDRGIIIAGDDGYLNPERHTKFDLYRYRFNGTAHGAYDFAERILGVRYYYPGIGVYAPKLAELNVKPVSYKDSPVYSSRFHYAHGRHFMKGVPWPGVKSYNVFDKAWRLAIATRFLDPIHTPVPTALEAAHPDKKDIIYYKDRYGVVHSNPKYAILDVTSLDLAHLIVQDFKAYYDTDGKENMHWRNRPESRYLSGRQPNSEYAFFGQADHYLNDLPNKYQYLVPELRKNDASGSMTDVYMRFYNAMAKEMKQVLPGKRLGVCSYHNYRLPPVLTKPEEIEDNIDMLLCTGTIVLAKSPFMQKELKSIYGGWAKALRRPVAAYTYGVDIPFIKALEGNYMRDFINTLSPYLWKEGGVFFDAGFDYHFYYSYYLVFRTYWNPAFDNQAALDEHWNLLYGPKAGAILKKFYALLQERWEKVYLSDGSGDSLVGINTSRLYQAFNKKTVDQLESMLNAAREATAPGSIERQRLEFFAEPWPKAFQSAKSYHSMVIPVHKVTRLEQGEKITIDGNPDEAVWKRADVIRMQQANGEGGVLASKPEGRIVWDDNGLYFSFSGHGNIVAKAKNLWGSDNIEFFLAPGTNKEVYYQFAVSAAGDVHQAMKVEKPVPVALNSHWRCAGFQKAVTVKGDVWNLEFFIPFAGLMNCKAPQPYTTWDGNLISNKNLKGKANEYSSFSLTMGSNHNPNMWGKFHFMGFGD